MWYYLDSIIKIRLRNELISAFESLICIEMYLCPLFIKIMWNKWHIDFRKNKKMTKIKSDVLHENWRELLSTHYM